MKLNHWERRTLLAIHDGETGPHRVSVLWSLRQKGMITDHQRLTAAGLRIVAEEHTRRRDDQIRAMRDSVRETKELRRKWFGL